MNHSAALAQLDLTTGKVAIQLPRQFRTESYKMENVGEESGAVRRRAVENIFSMPNRDTNLIQRQAPVYFRTKRNRLRHNTRRHAWLPCLRSS